MKKIQGIFLVLLLALSACPAPAYSQDCVKKYDRKLYPHWQAASNSKFRDIRQETIAKAVISGLKVERGRVVAGLWYDPFTGKNYQIEDVNPDVDHLASLGWIHERGGDCMTPYERRRIANDPDNLWAVHPSANRKKGKDVTGFLPPNLGICTDYLKQIKLVVKKHRLKLKPFDVKSYNVAVVQCKKWRNGIKLKKAKTWFESLFGYK